MIPNQQIYFKIAAYGTFKLAGWVSLMASVSASPWQKPVGAFLTTSSSFSSLIELQWFSDIHPSLHSQELQRGSVTP